ncbi:MAG: hypothetical protein L6Q92_15880 [Phycisphaerae bacterium]|nr:hypothetical protein [Phycisphaerae bacterium]
MPLKVRCKHCGAELVLHDAFSGASCRCRHCRAIFDVPSVATASTPRSHARPPTPRLAVAAAAGAAIASASRASAAVGAKSSAVAGKAAVPAAKWASLLSSKWTVAAGVIVAVSISSISWVAFRGPGEPTGIVSHDGRGGNAQLVLNESSRDEEPAPTIDGKIDIPPLKVAIQTYFAQPLTAPRIAWVVDGGENMGRHYENIASLTKFAMMQVKRGSQSYGVVVATPDDPKLRSIDQAGPRSYRIAKQALDDFTPAGRANLPRAFAAAARQRPDVTFLVVARELDREELREIRRQAAAIGTTVNVIAIESDQRAIKSLAAATSGTASYLDGGTLEAWTKMIASRPVLMKLEHDYLLGAR